MSKEWFSSWFDSEYYHILYKNRDYSEAEHFVSNLLNHLKPSKNDKFLDLACGKGRHSIFINKKGYNVVGLDLSENSISEAKKSENDSLRFGVHDMREIYSFDEFDFVFNLFTSFGYFDNEIENLNVLTSIKRTLKPGGIVVIDFLNTQKVINTLIPKETKTIDGIVFKIKKEISDGKILKHIRFSDNSIQHHYTESVQLINFNRFQSLFNQVGLQIIDTFGNYELEDYNEQNSNRLIIFAQKI